MFMHKITISDSLTVSWMQQIDQRDRQVKRLMLYNSLNQYVLTDNFSNMSISVPNLCIEIISILTKLIYLVLFTKNFMFQYSY